MIVLYCLQLFQLNYRLFQDIFTSHHLFGSPVCTQFVLRILLLKNIIWCIQDRCAIVDLLRSLCYISFKICICILWCIMAESGDFFPDNGVGAKIDSIDAAMPMNGSDYGACWHR